MCLNLLQYESDKQCSKRPNYLMQITMLPHPTYLVMLILDFLHPCGSVIDKDQKHKGFITDGQHIFPEELFIVCAIAHHLGFVVPNS